MDQKTEAKIAAREWIIAAMQSYSGEVDKWTQREVERLIHRFQRDLNSLKRVKKVARKIRF